MAKLTACKDCKHCCGCKSCLSVPRSFRCCMAPTVIGNFDCYNGKPGAILLSCCAVNTDGHCPHFEEKK